MQTAVPLLVACLITLPLFPRRTAEAAPPPVGLALSEILPTNHDGLPDDAGAYPDWIELVNTSDHPISTDGFALSDDQEQPRRWPLPDMTIQPDGHLTIFASGRDQTHLPGTALLPRDVPGLTAWLSTRDGLTP
ncbi:MAG: lamin tail domain-containing protein, partial [Verrucomicrobiota bacterium]|nr:lamin tail domain-containing protein [Verrucomicrobiota bacterium]